jgi:hypothetical protein
VTFIFEQGFKTSKVFEMNELLQKNGVVFSGLFCVPSLIFSLNGQNHLEAVGDITSSPHKKAQKMNTKASFMLGKLLPSRV